GILQPPYFSLRADDATNYGAIGSIIGHELTHGFDDQGTLYDADGNLRQWRTQQDKLAFNRRAKVMVRQADGFEALPGEYLKGQLTLGENIADLGGIEIAYEALQKAVARQDGKSATISRAVARRFFFSYALAEKEKEREETARQSLLADPHAPGEFRVNNTVRNVDGYYTAFAVKSTDKLYLPPAQRVRIW
ncbi:hypothetical protein HY346_00470, partial [Candidatus Microgenomates bacterium]|nr:hypothetical protein [Candidatus Microgenomates bacterium]